MNRYIGIGLHAVIVFVIIIGIELHTAMLMTIVAIDIGMSCSYSWLLFAGMVLRDEVMLLPENSVIYSLVEFYNFTLFSRLPLFSAYYL